MKKLFTYVLVTLCCLCSIHFNVIAGGCNPDTLAPVAVCPPTIDRVELDSSGMGTLPADIGDGSSMDDCSVIETSPSMLMDCNDVGLNTVILTAKDTSGNESSMTCYFVVRDKIAPIPQCPVIADLKLNAAGIAYLPENIGSGSSTDNCGQISETSPADTFYCADTGTQSLILTVNDVNGNESSKECFFKVLDNIPPQAICPASIQDVILDSMGLGTLPANIGDGSSTDNCGITETSPELSLNCSHVGTQNVVLTATDPSGNIDTELCSFEVIDNISPLAKCKDITVYLDDQGKASIDSSDVDDNSFDACGIATIALSKSSFDCDDIGKNSISVLFTDVNSNQSSCNSSVLIVDSIAPIAKCISGTFYFDAKGGVHLDVSDIDGGSSDECLDTIALDTAFFDCSAAGSQLVILTITDKGGNSASCTSKIELKDTTAPKAICHDSLTIALNSNKVVKLFPLFVDNGSYDNCSYKLSIDKFFFDCDDIGKFHNVQLTITDEFGKQDSCTSVIDLYEIEKPIALCKPSMTYALDANGNVVITPDSIDAGSTDNCEIVSRSVDFPVLHCGSNLVTLTVTDASGNSSSCSTSIYTFDAVPPFVMCNNLSIDLGSSGVAEISIADVDGGIFDGCGIESIGLSQDHFSCLNVGSNSETLTVEDINGNISICTFNVEVSDDSSACTCDIPTDLTSVPDFKTAQLNWSSDANAVAYILRGRKLGGGLITKALSANSLEAKSLKLNTMYEWQVQALCSNGDTTDFSAADTFKTLNCGIPQNLATTDLSAFSATLNWDAVPNSIGYRVLGGVGNSVDVSIDIVGGGTTSYNASGLAFGVTFNWAVFAVCYTSPFIRSGLSTIESFTTTQGQSSKQADIENTTLRASVYPNPNNGEFILEIVNNSQVEMSIYDITGKFIQSKLIPQNAGRVAVSIQNKEKGVYLLKLVSGEETIVERIIIK